MHTLIKTTHRKELPYTSSASPDVWDALIDLDTDSTGQNIHLIYGSRYVAALPHDSGSCTHWNREHLWPRSRGVSNSGKDNTDLHHLRPVDCNVNSARGNRLFAQCGTAEMKDECIIPSHEEAASDTERDSYTFLPPADRRGDIARAIFYMDLRYDGSESDTLDLVVSDCPESVLNGAGMGYLSQLIQWHFDDPVDAEEIARNDRVCLNWQGNRNPFVDFPELVSTYFGSSKSVPEDGAAYICSIDDSNSSENQGTNPNIVGSSSPTPIDQSANYSFIAVDTPIPTNNNTPENGLIITGVIDGPLSGGLLKAIELFAFSDVKDLSQYGIGFANNGGGSSGVEFKFPSGNSVKAGTYIVIAYEDVQYAKFFEVAPDYLTGYVSINGDDAVELFFNGGVVDVFGDVNVDGTGTSWDYMDGWAYRKDLTLPNTIFTSDDWSFSGANELDSCTSNTACGTSFPSKSFQSSKDIPNSSIPSQNLLGNILKQFLGMVMLLLLPALVFLH